MLGTKRLDSSDCIVLSFPKSGRTWLRYFLALYISKVYKTDIDTELKGKSKSPIISFSHNYFDTFQDDIKNNIYITEKKILDKKKLIFLVRHPLDTQVSFYYHKKERQGMWKSDINYFFISNIYGIEKQSEFVLKLLELYRQHHDSLLLRYENIHKNRQKEFNRLVKFIFGNVNKNALKWAIENSTFNKMQQIEMKLAKKNKYKYRLGVEGEQKWNKDKNSLKVRKGKIGSYKDELDSDFIECIKSQPHTNQLLKELEYEDE